MDKYMSIQLGLILEEVLKCLTKPTEKIRISCPKNHVIYNPVILAGASAGQSCNPAPTDCVGTTKEIKRQAERCFWKKRCVINLCNVGNITACTNKMTARPMASFNATYIIIKQMHCIPKDIIIDVCSKPKRGLDFTMGIIRSHRGYPRRRPRSDVCAMKIPIKNSQTLILEVVTEDNTFPVGLTLQNVLKNDQRTVNISTMKEVMLHGNTTKALKIAVDYRWKRRSLYGFMLPFKAYESSSLDSVLKWPNSSRPVMKELGWILDVKPVIEQCAVNVEGHMRLTCENDEVIYSPAVALSGYTRRKPKCIFSTKTPCGGFSPDLLVQRNLCFWKKSCDIKWKKSSRIIVSKESKCIGYSASTIGLSGHRCVNKDIIADLCTNVTSPINDSWGIIRSHSDYPWNFDARFPECKRILMIGGRQAMMLIVQDMNLDPDGRDKFSVTHVKKSSSKEIMDAKSGREGSQVTVKGGKLVIKFKPFEKSKSGRGFVLVFRRFPVTRRAARTNFHNDEAIPTPANAALSDAAKDMSYRLSNRRLCSKRGKLRKRGHACNRRVWTDYFTRLE
ncbi:uncharacterized protein LOC123564675 isoform X2 [Mercenaria mercenaria]|uniref:uncharacterized protein LOC123564675 isoform X2 n=1 Tax=Mercenaria mercenaria TaxID=6596 RepID=UPI00234F4093|nr:uncharacterized protein LOC123564675 isoform X2 [Mercenaria mercenaria]